MIRFILILTTCILCFSYSGEQDNDSRKQKIATTEAKPGHPMYCVLIHTPGHNWKKGVDFQEQPRVMDHIQYMRQQFQEGLMIMGGPFLDNSGGMMIINHSDIEKATVIANGDPGVKSGLLNVSVKLWMVPMSSVQKIPEDKLNN